MSNGPFRPRYFLPGLLSASTPDPQLDPQASPLAQPGNGPIAGYTNTFSLNLVNFDWITWHNYEWENWIVVDALLNAAIGFLNIKGFWKPNTDYLAGQSVFDPANVSQLYLCLANHTSGTDFDTDKPLYWKTVDQAKPPVSSVFGRIGDVLAAAGDYAAFYANKATTEAHIARTDNPHGTTWGNLGGKPATFPPSPHNHVEAEITDLDKYTKAQVDAIDAAIRTDFTANDAALLNNINTRLALAGGTMTGFLMLHASPTALMHAATKGYVDSKIAALPPGTATIGDTAPTAPVIGQFWYDTTRDGLYVWNGTTWEQSWPDPPPGTAVGPTPPASPDQGQLWFRTVEPVGLFIWYVDADSGQWVATASLSGGVPSSEVTIVNGVVGTSGWQIVGDQLICWGEAATDATGNGSAVFPRAFKSAPVVHTGTRVTNAILNVQTNPTFITATGFNYIGGFNGTFGAVIVPWIAVGEARDADKMPKKLQLASGVAAFASDADARAGTRTDVVMSPALVQARSGVITVPVVGQSSVVASGIPPEATEIEVIAQYAGTNIANANSAIRPNGLGSGYVSNQNRSVHNASAQVLIESTSGFIVTMPSASDNLMGSLRLVRGNSSSWFASGLFRLNNTTQVALVGSVNVADITSMSFVPGGGGAYTNGSFAIRWRI